MSDYERTLKDIKQSVAKSYKSLNEPNYDFVTAALATRPFEHVLAGLGSASVSVTEDTDPNDDVSFGFLVSEGDQQLVVRMSMVGPFAAILRLEADGERVTVVELGPGLSSLERGVIHVLTERGLTILDREVMSAQLNLKLFNTESNDVRVFQALFTDIETLPWLEPKDPKKPAPE